VSGRRVGDYLLREPVAAGGSTMTYRAERLAEGSDAAPRSGKNAGLRRVLVETIKPGLRPSPNLVAALRREAELLDRLAHPLFPIVIDAQLAGDEPRLVLSDLGGPRLDAVLERAGRLELAPALGIAVELARALARMHRLGLVHGRLRAEQVELGPSGAVCLCSLGMARASDTADPTERDELSLLPEDMAPEQIAGEPEDARTDEYLLGLLLYRMLTGRKAFERNVEVDGGPRAHGHDVPKLPRYAPEAPAPLARLLERCLARRPRDRHGDLSSVASHLLRVLRALTSVPSEHLVCRALARAELGEEIPLPVEGGAGLGMALLRPTVTKLLVGLGLGLVAVAVVVLALRITRSPAPDAASGVRGVEQRQAELRVLAQPWAEIYVDGELVDVTPMGRPIRISPGRHEVRFKHPNAADQVRSVDVIAGQSLWLDVTMPVVRPEGDAEANAEPAAEQAR
jgi:serine/threonine-protein kinase